MRGAQEETESRSRRGEAYEAGVRNRVGGRRRGGLLSRRSVGLGVFFILFTGVYFYLATHLVHGINQNRLASDQQHNINLAETAIQRAAAGPAEGEAVTEALWSYFPHYTDGVVNPLWPWIASRFANEDHEVFFVRGKWFNVIASAVFCLLLGLWAACRFSALATMNLVLLAGFGALLKRSVFFQPEPVYYMFFFLAWAGCLLVMRKNSVWVYAAVGITSGLAYITKGSVQPLLLVFLFVSTIRWVEIVIFRRKLAREGAQGGAWFSPNHFIGLAFFAVAFLAVSGPRLHYAQEKFGNPFHSYPAYWMWMDSFADGVVFMQENPDRAALEALADSEIPSAGNYLKTHSPEEARRRLLSGSAETIEDFIFPGRTVQKHSAEHKPWTRVLPSRGLYLGALAGILVYAWIAAGFAGVRAGDNREGGSDGLAAFFVLGAATLYVLSYGWYSAIGHGDRFMLSLLLPLVFSLIRGSEDLMRRVPARGGARLLHLFYGGFHFALFGAIVYRLFVLVENPVFRA
ncbi:MAG: hypothetical protein ACC661_01355 [Verrucomicrobiales bacterium]